MMRLAKDIHIDLQKRYSLMAMGTDSEKRVIDMMDMIVKNIDDWPKDKEERDYTRPMFHALYEDSGYDVPETVEV